MVTGRVCLGREWSSSSAGSSWSGGLGGFPEDKLGVGEAGSEPGLPSFPPSWVHLQE